MSKFGPVEELHSMNTNMLWREIRDVAPLLPDLDQALWRVSLAPTHGPGFVEGLRDELDAECLYDWSGGLVWLALPTRDGAGFQKLNSSLADRGHATLIRASNETRATTTDCIWASVGEGK